VCGVLGDFPNAQHGGRFQRNKQIYLGENTDVISPPGGELAMIYDRL
jgi:hypothetical protein